MCVLVLGACVRMYMCRYYVRGVNRSVVVDTFSIFYVCTYVCTYVCMYVCMYVWMDSMQAIMCNVCTVCLRKWNVFHKINHPYIHMYMDSTAYVVCTYIHMCNVHVHT